MFGLLHAGARRRISNLQLEPGISNHSNCDRIVRLGRLVKSQEPTDVPLGLVEMRHVTSRSAVPTTVASPSEPRSGGRRGT